MAFYKHRPSALRATDWFPVRLQVYYWTIIRKMKQNYHPNRGVVTDAVTKIIVNDLVKNRSVSTSLQQFLEYEPLALESSETVD